MKELADVAVVGAGPVGCHTAALMAEKGYSVILIDRKSEPGKDIICSGVVSENTFSRFQIPRDSILRSVNAFTFISPGHQELDYEQETTFTHVIDRSIFDRQLFDRAQAKGVTTVLNCPVNEVTRRGSSYLVKTTPTAFKARAVVIATGVDYHLQKQLGMGSPAHFLSGSQIDMPLVARSDRIAIYLDQNIVPNSFAWVVPARENHVRIGVLVSRNAQDALRSLLTRKLALRQRDYAHFEIASKPIALGPIRSSMVPGERVIAVGEAAGQIKTTTGGGIFFGLLCSQIAAESLDRAIKANRPVEDYDVSWRSLLIGEIEMGLRLRKTATHVTNAHLERLFQFIKRHRFWVDMLLPQIDFDFHANVLLYCMESLGLMLKARGKAKK